MQQFDLSALHAGGWSMLSAIGRHQDCIMFSEISIAMSEPRKSVFLDVNKVSVCVNA